MAFADLTLASHDPEKFVGCEYWYRAIARPERSKFEAWIFPESWDIRSRINTATDRAVYVNILHEHRMYERPFLVITQYNGIY